MNRHILLVEDRPEDAAFAQAMLKRAHGVAYHIDHVDNIDDARARITHGSYDVVLLDLSLGPYVGLEVLHLLPDIQSMPPVVVLSGHDDAALALQAVRDGAQDFLVKQNVTPDLLVRSIEYALERRRLQGEVQVSHVEVEELAITNALTGLANRRGISARLGEAQAIAHRDGSALCAALIDCDDFKDISNTIGHAGGDAVLKRVADVIRSTVRPVDAAAHIGGDEFLILYTDTRIHEALAASERLRCRLASETFCYDTQPLSVSISTGVATVPRGVQSLKQLLPLMGVALKASKDQGKNQVRALLADRGLAVQATQCRPDRAVNFLRPFHQPIVDLVRGNRVAHEMLTRGPRGPCEMPLDMFQAAHEQGILERTDLSCFAACAESAAVLPGSAAVHINLYPSTLETAGPDPIRKALGMLPPTRVCIELSESQLIGTHDNIVDCVDELRRIGMRFAIADVGFGRSSLESLLFLEPDFVKLDRAMVMDVSNSRAKARRLHRIVRAIGHLRQDVIAAGVENKADLDVLADVGIHLGQGFYFGHPISAAAMSPRHGVA